VKELRANLRDCGFRRAASDVDRSGDAQSTFSRACCRHDAMIASGWFRSDATSWPIVTVPERFWFCAN
jgi:hypothetical protein